MPDALPILGFVTLQRLAELWLSARNTAQLKAQGAYEVGIEHYPIMVVLHAAWLTGLWFLAWPLSANWFLVGLYALLQIFRVWIIASLGERWTTRIIVLPNAQLIRSGPYRFLRHPNYLIVIAEIALLPLAFGLAAYAVIFSVANAALLLWRVRAEDRALANERGAV